MLKPGRKSCVFVVRLKTRLWRLFYTFFILPTLSPAVFGQANYAPPYTFASLAGLPQMSGTNDGTGSFAGFNLPTGPAVDKAGNLYLADNGNNTIRKVTPAGVVTTLAGQPEVHGTNDGTGSAAQFFGPAAVAVDSADNVYVADFDNYTVRKLTPVGTNWMVSTLAGTPGVYGTNDGTGSAARFYYPAGVAVDSARNVYVADFFNHTIRKLTQMDTNWVVTTLAGVALSSGTNDGIGRAARFHNPGSIAVDSANNLYVADTGGCTIRKMTQIGTNWMVTTLAGLGNKVGTNDGTADSARFHLPQGVALDANSNLYVADTGNDTIRKLTLSGTNWVVTTLAGVALTSGTNDGTGSVALFDQPYGVAVDSAGSLYVADSGNDTIRRGFLANGAPVLAANNGGLTFSNGVFGFNVTAASGQTVVVDATTDLVNWRSIWTNTVSAGVLYFSDPQSGAYSNHYYRAHLPSQASGS